MIDITGTDLRKFIAKVYELSKPQGMGFLHYSDGPLSDMMIDDILSHPSCGCVFSMDYVNGRSCKMAVHDEDGKLFIKDNWYDHSDIALFELLAATVPQYMATK